MTSSCISIKDLNIELSITSLPLNYYCFNNHDTNNPSPSLHILLTSPKPKVEIMLFYRRNSLKSIYQSRIKLKQFEFNYQHELFFSCVFNHDLLACVVLINNLNTNLSFDCQIKTK